MLQHQHLELLESLVSFGSPDHINRKFYAYGYQK